MTKSDECALEWKRRKTTFPFQKLAKQIDPKVDIRKWRRPLKTHYIFSDGSRLYTSGKGRSFQFEVL